jgi:hypothetical protein
MYSFAPADGASEEDKSLAGNWFLGLTREHVDTPVPMTSVVQLAQVELSLSERAFHNL